MWTTLAVVAALGSLPADGDAMTLSNIHLTYGLHGPVRTNSTLLPGDSLCISYEIEGISIDPDGKVLYSTALEFFDKQGKMIFKQEPKPQEAINSLGGHRLPGIANIEIGLAQPPGDYTVRVTINDRMKKKSKAFTRDFRVLPRDFGLIRVSTTSDASGQIPVAVPGAGETLWLNFGVASFQCGKTTKNPHIIFEMQIFDDKGNPTTAKPFTGVIDEKHKVDPNAAYLPGQFLLSLNRPGKFRIELKATCQVCGKTSTLSLPLTVVSPQN